MGNVDGNEESQAGQSARREARRRRAAREQAQADLSKPHKLLRAIRGPSSKEVRQRAAEKRWASGARGEELLAEALARRCPEVQFLHDRRMPGSRANIDHLAIAPSGVWVIDTKRYRGKVEIRKPLFGNATLRIAGRDQTQLIAGLSKQVAAVNGVLVEVLVEVDAEVPLKGCLCFVNPGGALNESGVPLVRNLEFAGFPLLYPRRLAKKLSAPGPVPLDRAKALKALLAERLPRA